MNTTTSFPRMHVSLYVSDISKTVNFYNQLFGTPASKVKPGYAKYILDKPSLIISFVENRERVKSNFGHLGFQVETQSALEQKMQLAEAASLVSKVETGTNCCYAKQDKFWVNDPDGIQWEVYYFHEDTAFNDPHYSMEESSSCCINETIVGSEMKENESCCTPGSGCC